MKLEKVMPTLNIMAFICLTVCMIFQHYRYYYEDEEAQRINETFVEALNSKNKNDIRELLCDLTLEQNDIDEQIEGMFDFFDPSIFPIEKGEVEYKAAAHSVNSIRTLRINTGVMIRTETKTYEVICEACIYSPDSEKIGVSEIKVIDKTDLPDDIIERNKAINEEGRQYYVGKYIS